MKFFPVRKFFQVKKLQVKKRHVKLLQVRKNLHVKKFQVRRYFQVKFFPVRKFFQVKKLQVKKRHVKLLQVRKNLHVKKFQVRKYFHVKFLPVRFGKKTFRRPDGPPAKPPWRGKLDPQLQQGTCRRYSFHGHGIRAQR